MAEYVKIPPDEFIKLVKKHNFDYKKIAQAVSTITKIPATVKSIRARVSRYRKEGLLPLKSGNQVSSGEVLKATSTLYDSDNKVVLQWVKTDADKTRERDTFIEAINELTTAIPATKPIPKPAFDTTNDGITTLYPLPDLHFGLLIHANESTHGYNWDVKKATEWIKASMQHLVHTSPDSKYAVITDLGDILHTADNLNRTTSGHQLDVDGRTAKIVKALYEVIVTVIDLALAKHETVYFYSICGNHSEEAPIYLKAFLSAWYKDEPRLIINDNNASQQYHIFGKVILMFSHGHELKPARAGEVLAYDNQKNFSQSEYRYSHFGQMAA